MTKYIIVYICFFCFSLLSYSVNPDIPYYPDGTAPNPEKNMLDVYVPSGITEPAPVLFFIHGGTWTYGDRSEFTAVGATLSDQEGFVTVVISYSLSDSLHPDISHPDHMLDVAQAFKWTVDNIEEYGGDPSRIIVMGHSAGAHLATLLATNTRFLDTLSIDIENIKAVISFNMGIYDIPKLYSDCGTWASMGYDLMGFSAIFGPVADSSFNWYDASPKYHLFAEMPPFIFFVSDMDMEQIIGGDFGGMGIIILPGEVQFTYNDFRAYQPADTFWLEGDHNSAFSDFVFDIFSRGRILTREFLDDVFFDIHETSNFPSSIDLALYPNPFNSSLSIDITGLSHFNNTNQQIKAQIFDLNGKHICDLSAPCEKSNNNTSFTWIPEKRLSSGIYLIRIDFGDNYFTKRCIFMK
ncbi:alpha/beta fold hydrolase [bacterium]|nr:alpha/beta fold hydrolase [bacterium]